VVDMRYYRKVSYMFRIHLFLLPISKPNILTEKPYKSN
jgi:hypothetical protein